MPNGYNSAFTGGHNDEYDERISDLETSTATLESNFTTLSDTLSYV